MRERSEIPPDQPKVPSPVPPRPQYEAPINWWRLDDTERAETLWVLQRWVPELVRRYGLQETVVPPCWYRHEALVQELLALFQYRNQQQVLPTAPPSAMLDFHVQFQLFIDRMRRWTAIPGCNGAQHLETHLQSWAADPVKAAQWEVEMDEFIEAMSEVAPSVGDTVERINE